MVERRFTLADKTDVAKISSHLISRRLATEAKYSRNSVEYKVGSGKVAVQYEGDLAKIIISKNVPRKISNDLAAIGGYRWRHL
ncbi:MAG: hypothetical protein PHQ66_02600 [Candidatus Nanoarchaeia archaeon]|nr:hypothetical protein [Candidatus Nanoarchaeia archaeon]MDD5357743.1 hypothetical protein [Candidatus Nanoarchaeia archaeon]MDD5588662.1 hypothetical protein [Candidatus Nanoarchaeia archaeon]